MVRVTNGKQRHKRHKKFIKMAKGFRLGRKNVYKQVRLALVKQGQHAYVGRKEKKREFRRLRIERINAFARVHGWKYSTLIDAMNKKDVKINRKILSNMMVMFPTVVERFLTELS